MRSRTTIVAPLRPAASQTTKLVCSSTLPMLGDCVIDGEGDGKAEGKVVVLGRRDGKDVGASDVEGRSVGRIEGDDELSSTPDGDGNGVGCAVLKTMTA